MRITKPTAPYRLVKADRTVMTRSVRLHELTDDPNILASLAPEIRSIRVFDDFDPFVIRLKERGIKIAIGSNLAQPYADFVRVRLGEQVDILHFSCEIGLIKPDPAFFRSACARLGVAPKDTMMIGDSYKNDFMGAQEAGLNATLIQRSEGTTLFDCLEGML